MKALPSSAVRLCSGGALMLLLALGLYGQAPEPFAELLGEERNQELGSVIAVLGDVNADGVPDFAVSSPFADSGNILNTGKVEVYSGGDLSVIAVNQGTHKGERFGNALVGLGDVNGDGHGDYAVGAARTEVHGEALAGSVRVFSGADGAQLYTLTGSKSFDLFGWSLASPGDIDDDGVNDLAVGSYWGGSLPTGWTMGVVYVHSGVHGSLIHSIFTMTYSPNDYVNPESLAALDDVDGDGYRDLLVGHGSRWTNLYYQGFVQIYSGKTGDLIFEESGLQSGEGFGRCVAAIGDLDGDAVGDFLVGSPNYESAAGWWAGRVSVYSGATQELLGTVEGDSFWGRFGMSVGGVGDVDGDGLADFLVGAPRQRSPGLPLSGKAYLYSGATLEVLWMTAGEQAYEQLGRTVGGVGDLTGDGLAELAVRSRAWDEGEVDNRGVLRLWTIPFSSLPLRVDAGGPYSGDEGAQIPLSAVAIHAEAAISWDLDGDGTFETEGAQVPVVFADNGVFEVTARAQLGDEVATDSAEVLVSNVAPLVEPLAPVQGEPGEALLFQAQASDPGADILVFIWEWGDGTPLSGGSPVSHSYASAGSYEVTLEVFDDDGASAARQTTARIAWPFVRGDANGDGGVDITDAVVVLQYEYAGGEAPACIDSADTNDDGSVGLADAILIAQAVSGGSPPLPPYPGCGQDPSPDELLCLAAVDCP